MMYRKILLALMGCLAAVSFAAEIASQEAVLSLDHAIAVIEKGLGSTGVSDRQAWDASIRILEAAKSDPNQVMPFKELLVREITRLDGWDHFKTELAGSYHENLVSALFPLADADMVPLFISKCKYGSFVKEGFARIGKPAIQPLIDELLAGRYTTCAAMSLATLATRGLGIDSRLSVEEKDSLRRGLRESAVPALERALRLAEEEEKFPPPPGKGRFFKLRIAESLNEIRRLLAG